MPPSASQSSPVRLRTPLAAALIAALIGVAGGAAGGCSGDDGRLYVENGRIYNTADPWTPASQELTLKQGTKLLEEIREDPRRMRTLTPEERRFLGKAAVGTDDER